MNIIRLGAAALLLIHLAGCHDSGPTAPRQSGSPPAPPLRGSVISITGFPLDGAVVEGVDDQGTRTTALTNRGYYELKVPTAGAMTVRASKEGYVSSEYRVELPRTVPAHFTLDFAAQSVGLRGDYRVTLAADAACVQLPAEVRTRAYDASLTPLLADYYQGTLRHGASQVGSFVAQVDGDLGSFYANDSESHVYERLGTSASLLIFFTAGHAPVDRSSFTVPMVGMFEYCADVSPTNVCRVPRATCNSSNHMFTLTRQ